ncbi:hypothetical protein PS9374_07016 [Planomonospora sphaerica]|uniref:Uncharacterized protein n=1 Tax=Planomonospora sphaerica TaxID=161355 RepID=A0A171DQI4_9ACTN|nr:hypothetical protein [Planomonospora sphaerica]GAT71325.1 hypothetical protein PS9374_07016 [Planomonospora sphaerica]
MIDRSGYFDVRFRSSSIFDLDARLPGMVFKEDAGDSLFCEFDAIFTSDLWSALCAMARWHGDEQIELLVLEPDCDTYYLPEHRMYPAVSLSVEAGADDYWEAVGWDVNAHESDSGFARSVAISGNVIAVTGPSGKWGCWGERDPEVAVFQGFPNRTVRNEWWANFGPFLEVADALESYISPAFGGRTVPDEYAAPLAANYRPSGR